MTHARAALPLLLLLVPGCFDTHGMPHGDAGPGRDAGILVLDTGGSTACGDVVCGPSEVCCSSTCSVCGPAGAVCPDIDCLPSCEADDARGVGPCEAELGWAWDGSGCVALSGCTCEGADCGALSLGLDSCEAIHAHCARSCGGLGGGVCAPDEFCDYPDDSCGAWDGTGTCRPRPTECLEPGGVPVCGCDGVDYWADCPANLSGVDRAHFGSCSDPAGYRHVRASRTCGPADGPAWSFVFSTSPQACGSASTSPLTIEIWSELEGVPPASYRIDAGFGLGIDGAATLCPSPGGPCVQLTGGFTVDGFFPGEVANLSYTLRGPDGRLYEEVGIELTAWCSLTFPGCG